MNNGDRNIYRGYEIERKGSDYLVYLNGLYLVLRTSHEAALNYVDQHKKGAKS